MSLLLLIAALTIADGLGTLTPQTASPEPMPVRVGSGIRPPERVKDVKAVYPAEAQRSGAQGVVVIEATVDATGKVRNAVVLRSIPLLDAAALEAVRQWEFAPTIVNGQAVPVIFTTTVNFTLGSPVRAPGPGTTTRGTPTAATVERARALFLEAREAIDVVNPSSQPLGLVGDARPSTQASLLIELAKAEAVAFPEIAADDAARAFALSLTMPGRFRDLRQPTPQDPALRRNVSGWMLKAQLQPDAIKVLVHARQIERALQLARDSDLDRADLFDAIIRAVPEDQILPLAAESRALDGTYPYVAIADRARGASSESVRRALLERAYSTIAAEMDFKQRSMALSLVSRTYDLVPPDLAFSTLADLMTQMLTRPSQNPGSPAFDRDIFGPEMLAVMMVVDPQRAASVAADHPDWDAARKTPGKTSLNPIGGPGPGVVLRNALPPSPPPPRPLARPLDPMTQAEFEQALTTARSMPPEDARVAKLTALGYLMLTNPPR
jgi:TonB family protein